MTTTNINQPSTPAIEHVKMHEYSMNVNVDMDLASIPVTVRGYYIINVNSFWPSTITPIVSIVHDDNIMATAGESYGFDEFCLIMGWDEYDTKDMIRDAVEAKG